MNDLKRLEQQIIKSAKENTDGENSYFSIKFENGSKINIVAFRHGDEGVANLDVDLNGMQPKDLLGKKVLKFEEQFDGEYKHLIMKFTDGKEVIFTPFASAEDQTAGLSFTVYDVDKIVAESLDENKYSDIRNGEYPMYKPQYEDGQERVRQDEPDDIYEKPLAVKIQKRINDIYDMIENMNDKYSYFTDSEQEEWVIDNIRDILMPDSIQVVDGVKKRLKKRFPDLNLDDIK